MQNTVSDSGQTPDLEAYLDQASALELARRSLVGAPVYAVISLIMLVGTPILMEYVWWVAAEASLLMLLGGTRVWFALGFEHRYERIGERAVVQFSILTALQSLTLGVLAAMVIRQYWGTQEAVLTIVLSAGCIAAGTSVLSVRLSAHLIFLACVLAPFGLAVYLVGGLANALLIIGFLVLMAFLVQDGGHARSAYIQQLKDHYDDQLSRRRMAVESEAKKEFLADIGHEIRTPVHSIIGMTALLLDENLGKRPREFTEIIRKSSEALVDLVDNIPGSVKTRRETQDAHLDLLNLRHFIDRVMDLYRSEASGKGLELTARHVNIPENVIFFDDKHLEQVLANLLSNAVEFTEQGSVTLSASCRKLEDGALDIEFSVADTGIGIPTEYLESAFDPFSPLGAKTSGKYGGGGLGLPLCKALVELMGGEIWLESSAGQGTKISFNIRAQIDPLDSAWQPAVDVLMDHETRFIGDLSQDYPHQVLVVDDDNIHREILCIHLSKMGYKVDDAEDGLQAVDAVMKGNYDLIFMDVRMPNMSGIEATRWIREHFDSDKDLRIIALTGDATVETRERCLRAGMDDFVPKPLKVKDLEALLQYSAGDAN